MVTGDTHSRQQHEEKYFVSVPLQSHVRTDIHAHLAGPANHIGGVPWVCEWVCDYRDM